MQIQSNQMIQPHRAKQSADHLGRARLARTAALFLPGVTEVRHDSCYPRSTSGSNRIGQQCQHHQVIIHRRAGRLNDEHVRMAHVLSDAHARLAIGEGPDFGGHERHL